MAEINLFHYLPGKSIFHVMDSRIKLISMFLLSIAVAVNYQPLLFLMLSLALLLAIRSSGLPLTKFAAEMRYFLLLIGVVLIVHATSIPGEPLPYLAIPGVSREGLSSGILFGWRMILIIVLSVILTGTTTLSALKNAIEWLLRPIPGIPGAKVATMFSLTLILIPLLFEEAAQIGEAQKARCIEGRRNPVKRIILLAYPLLTQVLTRADEMASAMESRCYSEERTPVIFKKISAPDGFVLFFSLALAIFSVALNLLS